MDTDTTSSEDRWFAHRTGEALVPGLFTPDTLFRRGFVQDPDQTVLAAVEDEVRSFTGKMLSLSPPARWSLVEHIRSARRVLLHANSIIMLRGSANGFDLDVMVDMFNERARKAFSLDRQGLRPGIGENVSDASWAADEGNRPQRAMTLRAASTTEAAISFMTLFVNAVRLITQFGGGRSGSGIPCTAKCNLTGWVLDIWPEYYVSPSRFGSVPTSPVTDVVPTSGNYMFQGTKGRQLRADPMPHFLGPSRRQTLVKL
jgi:hypothetical protein